MNHFSRYYMIFTKYLICTKRFRFSLILFLFLCLKQVSKDNIAACKVIGMLVNFINAIFLLNYIVLYLT